MIYKYTGMPTAVYFDGRVQRGARCLDAAPALIPGYPARQALWNTCRQIRCELESLRHTENELTIHIRGKANLKDMERRMPGCLDLQKIRKIHISLLSPCGNVTTAQWFAENGLGMDSMEILELLPNLSLLEIKLDIERGALKDQVLRRFSDTVVPILRATGPGSSLKGNGFARSMTIWVTIGDKK